MYILKSGRPMNMPIRHLISIGILAGAAGQLFNVPAWLIFIGCVIGSLIASLTEE